MTIVWTIPRNGLVGEWLLDGNALDTNDGTKNNGTATNVTYTGTDRGYQTQTAVHAGTSYITSAFSSMNSGDFTMSCWAKHSNTSDTILFGSSAGTWWGIRFHATTVNTVKLFVMGNIVQSVAFTPWTTNWHHYVLTRSGNNYTLYDDTASILTNTTSGTFWTGTLNISGVLNNGTVPFLWNIQSFRFYNRVLSQIEIQSLYMEGLRKLAWAGLAPLSDGLVAYYDFNGDAQDIIGGNNGTVTGATLTTDRFSNSNRAYSFNGTTDWIALSTTNTLTNQFTFSFWFNSTNVSAFQWLFAKWLFATNTDSSWWICTGIPWWQITFSIFVWWTEYRLSTSSWVSNNTWYHCACTYDWATMKTYINWWTPVTLSASGNINNTTNPETWWRMGWYAWLFFSGKLEHWMKFNRALSASEVLALYQLSAAKYITPLLY